MSPTLSTRKPLTDEPSFELQFSRLMAIASLIPGVYSYVYSDARVQLSLKLYFQPPPDGVLACLCTRACHLLPVIAHDTTF